MKWIVYCETCKRLLDSTNSFIGADSTAEEHILEEGHVVSLRLRCDSDKFAVISIIRRITPESLGMLVFYSYSHTSGPLDFDDEECESENSWDNAVRIHEEIF